jgi:hypothetical protein
MLEDAARLGEPFAVQYGGTPRRLPQVLLCFRHPSSISIDTFALADMLAFGNVRGLHGVRLNLE